MTFIPEVPLWCWVLQGEDALFFSQPTHAFLCEPPLLDADGHFRALGAFETRWLDTRAACVARCQHPTQFVLKDDPMGLGVGPVHGHMLTRPIQCGRVAYMDRLGRYFCDVHMMTRWQCYHCAAFLPPGEGGFCSQACRADYGAEAGDGEE